MPEQWITEEELRGLGFSQVTSHADWWRMIVGWSVVTIDVDDRVVWLNGTVVHDTPTLPRIRALVAALGGAVSKPTPSNDELLGWAEKSQPLPELMKEEEDRPW